jgi:predicted acetyltransferase
MDYEIRAIKEDEVEDFLGTCMTAFSNEAPEAFLKSRKRLVEPERSIAAFDEDTMVGTAGAFRFNATVPGGDIPVAGVTLVGVLPTHRRRGVLKALMKRQLEDCREWGESIAILWASEGAIYPHFGYGVANFHGLIEVDSDKTAFIDPPPVDARSRLLSDEEALKVIPDVYERVRVQTPGMFSRNQTWWEAHRLFDPEDERDGGGAMLKAVVEIDGKAEAYCLYRVKHGWGEDGMHDGTLFVQEAMGTTPKATRAIWDFIFGVDLVARVKYFFIEVDTPLRFMMPGIRPLRLKVADALFLRVADLPKALEARSYATPGSIVLRVDDGFCPWNAGTWKIDVAESGRATVSETSEEPDIDMTVEHLGSVYLGGVGFTELARAMRIAEVTEGAAARADLLFHTPHAPWCPEIF